MKETTTSNARASLHAIELKPSYVGRHAKTPWRCHFLAISVFFFYFASRIGARRLLQ